MGLLSSTVSMTRYRIDGNIEKPMLKTVARAFRKNAISEIDNEPMDKAVGWTSFEAPFRPDFEGSSFSVGSHLLFSMRIDKKTIPPKLITKHVTLATSRRLAETGRPYLSKAEKKELKDHVINVLSLRIPAVPNVYDILWSPEIFQLSFFSNLKSANEEFETLFYKSFNFMPIRLFPYTMAYIDADLSAGEKDVLSKLTPTQFL